MSKKLLCLKIIFDLLPKITLLLRLAFLLVLPVRFSNCSPVSFCNLSSMQTVCHIFFGRLVMMFPILVWRSLMKHSFLHVRACSKLKLLRHAHVLTFWDNGHPYLMLAKSHSSYLLRMHPLPSIGRVVIHVETPCWRRSVSITDQAMVMVMVIVCYLNKVI